MEDGIHIFHRKNCSACGLCTKNCPGRALVLYGREMAAGEVFEIIAEDMDFYRETGGGITISGGEPLLQAGFSGELLRITKTRALILR